MLSLVPKLAALILRYFARFRKVKRAQIYLVYILNDNDTDRQRLRIERIREKGKDLVLMRMNRYTTF